MTLPQEIGLFDNETLLLSTFVTYDRQIDFKLKNTKQKTTTKTKL